MAADPKAVLEYIQKNFPSLLWAIKHPELGPILQQAVEQGMGAGELAARIQSTNYWKASNESSRAWDLVINTDPGQAQRKMQQSVNTVKEYAQRWGITLSDAEIFGMGDQNIRFGWNERDLNLHMGNIFRLKTAAAGGAKGPMPGEVGEAMQRAKGIAASYGFPASDEQAFKEAIGLMEGTQSEEGLKANYALYASSLYPAWKQQFDSGITLNELIEPYRQTIASDLEMAPEAVDFANDPKWKQVLSFVDPASGKTRPMSLSEAQSHARNQKEFQTTNKANQLATEAVDALAKGLGAEI